MTASNEERDASPRCTASVASVPFAAGAPPVEIVTLTNATGMVVRFMNRGGIILSIMAPDRRGQLADVTLGFQHLGDYAGDRFYFGALVGRTANRIAGARFELDGKEYTLTRNDGANHLHGGTHGFSEASWEVVPFEHDDRAGAELTLESAAGDQGYPGTLRARVTYTLTNANELAVSYRAVTDAPTPVGLTQHTYFNLTGEPGTSILQHELMLRASRYLPVDAALIPTGERHPVAGTPFDFTSARPVGAAIHATDPQLQLAGGYDHNFILDEAGRSLRGPSDSSAPDTDDASMRMPAVTLHDPASGRVVDVFTTEPGVQVYSGNGLDVVTRGRGAPYVRWGGIALETQHFPDTPNHPEFPSTVLRPGEQYASETVYRFSVTEPARAPRS